MQKEGFSSRRSPRRCKSPKPSAKTRAETVPASEPESMDSDFGLALRLVPALRRRPDA